MKSRSKSSDRLGTGPLSAQGTNRANILPSGNVRDRDGIVRLPANETPLADDLEARPFVMINMAMTADGKIAAANGSFASFGSTYDTAHLFRLRATADAVMSGANTIAAEDADLGPGPGRYRQLRLKNGLDEYNLRIVVSGSGKLDPSATIFRPHPSPAIVLTTERTSKRRLAEWVKAASRVVVCGERKVAFQPALAYLRREWGVRRLLTEGGGMLNAALFEAGLVDELHVTICPYVLGGQTAPTLADGLGVERLKDAVRLELKSKRRHGDEMFCVYSVVRPAVVQADSCPGQLKSPRG